MKFLPFTGILVIAIKMLMEDVQPPSTSTLNTNSQNEEPSPPSPLITEADEDEDGGPSSVEAQADPSDLSFDLDIDLPTTSYPLVSPQPSTSNDIFNEPTVDDQNPFSGTVN